MIKRMEPLAEDDEKLREAMKLMEKNIQRAQHERDLAETHTKDWSTKRAPYPSS